MNETEFLRGIEGNEQNSQDLVSGAEHLIRLKQQVGMIRPADNDLELELAKEAAGPTFAGQAGGAVGRMAGGTALMGGAYIMGKKHGKEKDAGEPSEPLTTSSYKTASLKEILEGARSGLKFQAAGASGALKGLKIPGARSRSAGALAGMAAPALAVGGAGYLAGKSGKSGQSGQDKTAAASSASKLNGVKSAVKDYLQKHPVTRSAAIGGAVGGATNAALGAAQSPGDRVGGAIRGGVTGTAMGASSGALFHHLNTKLAEMREKTANSILDRLSGENIGLATATGLGAVAGGLGTYLSSRAKKDTGKSRAEEELEGQVEAQKSKPERGLLTKMHHRNTELEHGYAKAFRDHPAKASMIGAITGGVGGYGIGKLLGGLSKLRGAK